MAETQGGTFLRQLRKLVGAQTASRMTDRQLLELFLARQDETAFAALVQRHGPSVLGLCRGLLQHFQDAEDVFQATFLVLARKAGSIRKRESLGSWLYGVAHRLACKARARASRRSSQELAAAMDAEAPTVDDMTWREIRLVLHEELSRLPEKYRLPLLLCYWEGKTQEEAAAQLGWRKGTLKDRVQRARELLRGRLTRRGVTLSAGLVTAMLGARTGTAAEALALVNPTTRAALAFAAGKQAVAGGLSSAIALAEGVVRAMFLTKVKIAAVVLLSLGLLGTGAGLVGQQGLAAGDPVAQGKAKPGQAKTDQERIQGTWAPRILEKEGKPAPQQFMESVRVRFTGNKVMFYELGKKEKGEEGTFTLRPNSKPKEIDLMHDGKTIPGIYEWRGDELWMCVNDPHKDKERPTEFKSAANDERALLVLRREKAAQAKTSALRDDLRNENDPAKLRERIRQLERELAQTRDLLKETQAQLAAQREQAVASQQEAQAQRRQADAERERAQVEAERARRQAEAEVDAARKAAQQRLEEVRQRQVEQTEAQRRLAEAQRQKVTNNLRQLGIAMHNYHDTYGHLPPAATYSKDGKPLLSWRVAILPYLDQQELYKQFKLDEPWDSPHNKKLLAKMPQVFAPVAGKAKENSTFYRVFTGQGTVFEGKEGIRLQDITDGTSKTMMIVEAGNAVPWTKPDELPYNPAKALPKLGQQFKDGFYHAMCDGSVHFVRTPINEKAIQALITRNAGD